MIGAAPAPLELFEFFAAIGIPICEVWGMSELSSVATLVPRDGSGSGPSASRCPASSCGSPKTARCWSEARR